jgi:hypothetical protein
MEIILRPVSSLYPTESALTTWRVLRRVVFVRVFVRVDHRDGGDY